MTLLVVVLAKGTARRRGYTPVGPGWIGNMNPVGTSVVVIGILTCWQEQHPVLHENKRIPQHYVLDKDIANSRFLTSHSTG